jgi:hypothetical protein
MNLTSGATGMSHAPEFTDNRDGNTLAEALAQVLGGRISGMPGARPAELAIASAFFSPRGLADLTPYIDRLRRSNRPRLTT